MKNSGWYNMQVLKVGKRKKKNLSWITLLKCGKVVGRCRIFMVEETCKSWG